MPGSGTVLYKAIYMDNNTRILSLIEKFEQGRATDEEMQELEVWFRSFDDNPDITEALAAEHQQKAKSALFGRINSKIDDKLVKELEPIQRKPALLWARIMIAATVLVVVSVGAYFMLNRNRPVEQTAANLASDFAPGSKKAILTLGNGQRITLNDAKNGKLAKQGNAIIRKTDENEVVYQQNGNDQTALINTLATPRGGEYHLTLADGTKVWLNTASSITYPSSFTGNFREVEISGEVYFEVAHNADKPFHVKTGTQTVEVLGTHFNINAYDKQNALRTTLLQGSVAIASAGQRKLLKPGEQAVWTGSNIAVNSAELDEVMAWRDGFFDFTDADIHTVMQEFSRWYDLDIVFDGPQTRETFTGRLPRSWSFAKVMKLMESFKSTHLTVEGRRIMVRQ